MSKVSNNWKQLEENLDAIAAYLSPEELKCLPIQQKDDTLYSAYQLYKLLLRKDREVSS